MINIGIRLIRSLFIFLLVYSVYKVPSLWMEGYHDRAVMNQFAVQDQKYILDLISPIWIISELVAFSCAYFIWKKGSQDANYMSLFIYIYGVLGLLGLIIVSYTLPKMWMNLDGNRLYNEFHYIGTICSIFIAVAPWIYRRWIQPAKE